MGWFETTPFPEGIFRLREPGLGPLHSCNIWLVLGRKAALLIDTGSGIAPLSPVIRAITPLPVFCLLTHSHFDHIGGAYEFETRLAHPAEAGIMAGPTPENTLWQGYLQEDSFLLPPPAAFRFADYAVQPAAPTRFVQDGEHLDLGGRMLTCIHLPGHAPGLLGIVDAVSGALFSSDALYDGRMFFNLPGSDRTAARRSLDRIEALDPAVLYPGHFEPLDRASRARVIAGLRPKL